MTAFMHRLQTIMPLMPPLIDENEDWQFSHFLANQAIHFYRPIIKDHLKLTIEYSILSAQLAADLMRPEACPTELTEQIASALIMSELLAYLYRNYLLVPREVERLRKDQLFYRKLLQAKGIKFANDLAIHDAVKPDHVSQRIRTLTAVTNPPRLLLTRCKRLLGSCSPFLKQVASYGQFVELMDNITNPALANLGWGFYAPRLGTNFWLLFQHIMPGIWMGAKEKESGWLTRADAHFQRRWFELGNDLPWLAGGVLCCFVLTGTLAPVGVYLTVGLFGYDVLLAGIRAFIELKRLEDLQKYYRTLLVNLQQKGADKSELEEVTRYQHHLQVRLDFEQKRMALAVINTSFLFFAMCLTMPAIAVNPVIPLVAAILLVLTSAIAYYAQLQLEKRRPPDKITSLESSFDSAGLWLNHGFFSNRHPQSTAGQSQETEALILSQTL